MDVSLLSMLLSGAGFERRQVNVTLFCGGFKIKIYFWINIFHLFVAFSYKVSPSEMNWIFLQTPNQRSALLLGSFLSFVAATQTRTNNNVNSRFLTSNQLWSRQMFWDFNKDGGTESQTAAGDAAPTGAHKDFGGIYFTSHKSDGF